MNINDKRPRPRTFLHPILLCILWLAALTAQSQETLPGDGWEEAVISVSELDETAEFFIEVAGYETLHRGTLDATRLAYWGLPADSEAREIVLGNPAERRGRIRLLEFEGVERRHIRPAGQPWDTGGWFALSLWAQDLDEVVRAAQRHHWQPLSEPMRIDGPHGRLRGLLLRGQDGVTLMLYELPDSPPEEVPDFDVLSAPFSAAEVVNDLQTSSQFYRRILGLQGDEDNPPLEASTGVNPFGLPVNLADHATRHYELLHPAGAGRGALELLQWPQLEGRDFSALAVAPHLGLLALRYRVPSTTGLAQELRERGAEPDADPVSAVLPPYGIVHQIRLRSPGGADLEFFSVLP